MDVIGIYPEERTPCQVKRSKVFLVSQIPKGNRSIQRAGIELFMPVLWNLNNFTVMSQFRVFREPFQVCDDASMTSLDRRAKDIRQPRRPNVLVFFSENRAIFLSFRSGLARSLELVLEFRNIPESNLTVRAPGDNYVLFLRIDLERMYFIRRLQDELYSYVRIWLLFKMSLCYLRVDGILETPN